MSAVTPMPTIGGGGSDPPAPPQQPHHHEAESITVVSVCDCDPPTGSCPPVPVAVQQTAASTPSDHHHREDLRGWLMVLDTLIASITYAAGLNPPGGFERVPVNSKLSVPTTGSPLAQKEVEYMTMAPVLRGTNVGTYMTFYYCNTAAFALSLSLILLLASPDLRKLAKTRALEVLVALDVMALLVAYVVGSSFGLVEIVVCAGLVLDVPAALVIISSSLYGKYFWDEV